MNFPRLLLKAYFFTEQQVLPLVLKRPKNKTKKPNSHFWANFVFDSKVPKIGLSLHIIGKPFDTIGFFLNVFPLYRFMWVRFGLVAHLALC